MNKKRPPNSGGPVFTCDRDRIRTCDRLLRRQMLYPAELRDPMKKSGCKLTKIMDFVSGKRSKDILKKH